MALHGGLDTVGVVSLGVYSETYTSADTGNLPSVFSSYGYLEDAPTPSPITTSVKYVTVRMPGRNVLQIDTRQKRKIFM